MPKDNAPEGVEAGTQVGRPVVSHVGPAAGEAPLRQVAVCSRSGILDLHPHNAGEAGPAANTTCRWDSAMG